MSYLSTIFQYVSLPPIEPWRNDKFMWYVITTFMFPFWKSFNVRFISRNLEGKPVYSCSNKERDGSNREKRRAETRIFIG